MFRATLLECSSSRLPYDTALCDDNKNYLFSSQRAFGLFKGLVGLIDWLGWGRERNHPLTVHSPNVCTQLELDQAETRSWKLSLNLPCGWQGPKTCHMTCYLPGCTWAGSWNCSRARTWTQALWDADIPSSVLTARPNTCPQRFFYWSAAMNATYEHPCLSVTHLGMVVLLWGFTRFIVSKALKVIYSPTSNVSGTSLIHILSNMWNYQTSLLPAKHG